MGNWTSQVTLPPIEFDGDSIVFTCGRMMVEDMMSLSKHFDQETGVMRFDDQLQVLTVAQGILGKYIKSMTGMSGADGAQITVEEFCNAASKEFYFVPLVGELLGKMVAISTVGSATKNS